MQNCETIVKFSALEGWEFHGLFLFHGLILDAFWDTSDCWKINILVAFLSAKYQWNFLRYVGKVRKTRIWHCLVASLIGLECAGDRSCAFLSELVKEGKVSVAFYASILLNLNITTILQRSRSSFGLNTVDFMWRHGEAFQQLLTWIHWILQGHAFMRHESFVGHAKVDAT